MATRENNPEKSKESAQTQAGSKIVDRLGYGSRSGETTRAWLKDAESLSKEAEKTLGKRGVGRAWMQGIFHLATLEIAHNDELNDPVAHMLDRYSEAVIGLTTAAENRKTRSGEAAKLLSDLRHLEEFAVLHGILKQNDVGRSIKAAGEAAREVNSLLKELVDGKGTSGSRAFSGMADVIEKKALDSLEPS
jgi:hypothetical protein